MCDRRALERDINVSLGPVRKRRFDRQVREQQLHVEGWQKPLEVRGCVYETNASQDTDSCQDK